MNKFLTYSSVKSRCLVGAAFFVMAAGQVFAVPFQHEVHLRPSVRTPVVHPGRLPAPLQLLADFRRRKRLEHRTPLRR